MFWDKWIPRKYFINSQICLVEVCFDENDTVYYYTQLKNKNNKLELSATEKSVNELQFPPDIVKNKIPIIFIVNGKGVITKKIILSVDNVDSFDNIVHANMPTLNFDDFFIQLYKQSSVAFISLCRRDALQEILKEAREKKYDVADIFIGAPAIIGLQPLWTNFNSIRLSRQTVELTNGELDNIKITTEPQNEIIKIEELVFSSEYTLGMAGGLAYFMQHPLAENDKNELAGLSLKHTEKNKFRFLIIVSVVIAFVVAVINVVFYTSYFGENNKIETELSVYQGKYEQINQLLNDYQKNKDLIEEAGVLNKNKLSEYADRIGKTLPDEIVLSELYFNPKEEKDESTDSLVTFMNKHLILRGNCGKSFIVNEWLNVLKMQKFIKAVSLEKFVYNNNEVSPNFEIKLITE